MNLNFKILIKKKKREEKLKLYCCFFEDKSPCAISSNAAKYSIVTLKYQQLMENNPSKNII